MQASIASGPDPAGEYAGSDFPSSSIIGVRKVEYGYLLWLVCLVGVFGVHRMYAGRWVSGIIWLLTGGLCLIGQLVDLFLIPGMIEQANLEEQYQRQYRAQALRT
jgi:TM2 domain-containing membrane protein YozV